MKTLCILLATAVLCGCNSPTHYNLRPVNGRVSPLSREARVYVGISDNSLRGSGRSCALAFAREAKPFFTAVEIGTEAVDLKLNLINAQAANCRYLFLPRITNREDNATAWSGKSDRLEVELATLDVATSKQLDVGTVEAVGPWWTLENFTPEDFLDGACRHYLRYLVGEEAPGKQDPPPTPARSARDSQ